MLVVLVLLVGLLGSLVGYGLLGWEDWHFMAVFLHVYSLDLLVYLVLYGLGVTFKHAHSLFAHLDLFLSLAYQRIYQLGLLHDHIPHPDACLVQAMVSVVLSQFHLVYFIGEVDVSLVDVCKELVGLLEDKS